MLWLSWDHLGPEDLPDPYVEDEYRTNAGGDTSLLGSPENILINWKCIVLVITYANQYSYTCEKLFQVEKTNLTFLHLGKCYPKYVRLFAYLIRYIFFIYSTLLSYKQYAFSSSYKYLHTIQILVNM